MEIENKIFNEDCLEGMKKLDDRCVDVTFTSPPYNDTGGENQSVNTKGSTHKKYIHVERKDDWLSWQIDCIDQMLRVSKKYVLYNIQALSKNRKNVYKLIGHFSERIHDIIVWHKPNGTPTSTPNKISNTYEFVLILKCDGVEGVDVNSEHYKNLIKLPTYRNEDFSDIHRAVMSKDFCLEIIKEFTKKDDLVLDPFMGLGTTAICCIDLERKYVGFEIAKEYYDISLKRISENATQTNIFDFID